MGGGRNGLGLCAALAAICGCGHSAAPLPPVTVPARASELHFEGRFDDNAAAGPRFEWPGSAVWSAPSLKPLDAEPVADICRRHAAVIVLEEHSIHGGLGAAVAEVASSWAPTWAACVPTPGKSSRSS